MMDRHDRRVPEISVEAELATWGDDRVYFDPMWGNHGDRLIVMGSEVALATAGIRRVPDVREADRIVINGAGYRSEGEWLAHMARLVGQADGVPVMIMPATFEDPAGILSLLDHHAGSSIIYFREQTSYRMARDIGVRAHMDLRLDHDMAFRLRESEYLVGLHDVARSETVLIVERTDGESVSGSRALSFGPSWLKTWVPESLKLKIKREVRQASARSSGPKKGFAVASIGLLGRIQSGHADLPIVAGDISRIDFCTFDQFGAYVANAAVVLTTRLHVGILAALLGKETYLVPGVYHKMAAVYEYSLADMPGVHLLDLDSLIS